MARQLQVWGVAMHVKAAGRQCRAIVAATSRNEAALLLHCPPGFLKTYGCVTGNATEVAVGMSKPRTVFYTKEPIMGGEYVEVSNG